MEEYTDDGETFSAPKYVQDEDRLDGYSSGGPFTRQEVEDAGYEHLLAHNDAEKWRVVVVWGEGNEAWDALNEIHAFNHDTETLADHGKDVSPVMDDKFGEEDWEVDWHGNSKSENTA